MPGHILPTMKQGMTRANKEHLLERARALYTSHMSLKDIATALGLNYDTVRKWAKKHDFAFSLKTVPTSVAALIEALNKKLKRALDDDTLTADSAVKYTSAIEKLSDKNKASVYLMQSFEDIKNGLLAAAQKAPKKEKEKWLFAIKQVKEVVDELLKSFLIDENK